MQAKKGRESAGLGAGCNSSSVRGQICRMGTGRTQNCRCLRSLNQAEQNAAKAGFPQVAVAKIPKGRTID